MTDEEDKKVNTEQPVAEAEKDAEKAPEPKPEEKNEKDNEKEDDDDDKKKTEKKDDEKDSSKEETAAAAPATDVAGESVSSTTTTTTTKKEEKEESKEDENGEIELCLNPDDEEDDDVMNVKGLKVTRSTIKQVAAAMIAAKRIVVFTGAGMSQESGINTFRDPEMGLWKNKLGLAMFGTPFGWKIMSGLAWKMYKTRFYDPIAKAQPNEGHKVIAELPDALGVDVRVITQNVDFLHQRAGTPQDKCYEVHGTVMRHRCVRNGHVSPVPAKPGDPFPETNPNCPICGSGMRPDATLFTEDLPRDAWSKSEAAISRLESGDVLIVVGTSGSVWPAAGLPIDASKKPGVFSVEINPSYTEISPYMHCHISATPTGSVLRVILNTAIAMKEKQAGADMKEVLERLRKKKEEKKDEAEKKETNKEEDKKEEKEEKEEKGEKKEDEKKEEKEEKVEKEEKEENKEEKKEEEKKEEKKEENKEGKKEDEKE